MKSRQLISAAMESIWFQDGKFGLKLEKCIEDFRDQRSSITRAQKSEELENLERVIFDYTGINAKVILEDEVFAATISPVTNANHIFKNDGYSPLFDNENSAQAMHNLTKDADESHVNLKEGRVSGKFSELKSVIYLGYGTLIVNKDFTVREVVGILLHEIGHNFTMFEFTNRFITTNQVLAIVSKSIMDKETAEQRSILVKRAGRIIADDEAAFAGYEEITDTKILTNVFIEASFKRAASELGLPAYDQTSMESLADNYAARHGYARDVVTGLDKAVKNYAYEYKSTGARMVIILIEIAILVVTAFIIATPVIWAIQPFVPLFLAFLCVSRVFGGGYGNMDYTYDTFKVRYKRLREQEIHRLKLTNITAEDKKFTLDSIEKIDTIISTVGSEEDWIMKISLFLFKSNRGIKAAKQLQRDLEELSANNLFVASAKLSTLLK